MAFNPDDFEVKPIGDAGLTERTVLDGSERILVQGGPDENVDTTPMEFVKYQTISEHFKSEDLKIGTTAGTACEGNDKRLSDARTPIEHTHTFTGLENKPTTLGGFGITDAFTTEEISELVTTKKIIVAGKDLTKATNEAISSRDFINGTLVKTNINYSVTDGDPWFVEIRGNTYGDENPLYACIQGYIYSDAIINYAGWYLGVFVDTVTVMNIDGYLCFWWPRQSYWVGYSVSVYTAHAGQTENRVTSIIDTEDPVGTKRVSIPMKEYTSLKDVGSVVFFARTSAPSGYLPCNGAAVSRTAYSNLYSVIGTVFGEGNGSSTFNLPDLRDDFIRGSGTNAVGTRESWAIQNIAGYVQPIMFDDSGHGVTGPFGIEAYRNRSWDGASGSALKRITFDASKQVQTSTETRPRNISLLACIKY